MLNYFELKNSKISLKWCKIVCIQYLILLLFILFEEIKHAVSSTFEAENRLFHKHAEAQLKKVRAYKKKVYWVSDKSGIRYLIRQVSGI